ncbi:MAG: RecX family transcriptional regulator [Firmicutes bacterium]|nr:RecX family transcriptional regulator [Bacillota bacterium]
MIITDILPQKRYKKLRSNIYVDGKFYCGLMNETVVKEKLEIGAEVSESRLAQIQLNSEKLWALDKAFGYISYKMRSKKEVVKYLQDKGFLDVVVEYCLARLSEYKYVDDTNLSELLVSEYSKKGGKFLVKDKLIKKGIDKDLIEQHLSDFEEDDGAAYRLLEKYLKNKITGGAEGKKNFEKAIRHLQSRGFTWDTIKNVLARYRHLLDEGDINDWD